MSEQRCLREILSDEELGDRKPSQLLRRMRQLLGQRKFDDMHSHSSAPTLPAAATGSSASILAVSKDSVSLEDMAELADRILGTRRSYRFLLSHFYAEYLLFHGYCLCVFVKVSHLSHFVCLFFFWIIFLKILYFCNFQKKIR